MFCQTTKFFAPWQPSLVRSSYFANRTKLIIQSNLAISNSVNSRSPLFRRKIECPWIYPSPLRFPGYFEAPLFRTFFHFPWDFEIAGFDCSSFIDESEYRKLLCASSANKVTKTKNLWLQNFQIFGKCQTLFFIILWTGTYILPL